MTKAALSVGTIFRLLIPTKISGRGAGSEIEGTKPAGDFIDCLRRVRTVPGLIGVCDRHFLPIAPVPDCDMHGTTRVQSVIVHPVRPLVRVNLF